MTGEMVRFIMNNVMLVALGAALVYYSPKEQIPGVLTAMVAYLTKSPLQEKSSRPTVEPPDEDVPGAAPQRPSRGRVTK